MILDDIQAIPAKFDFYQAVYAIERQLAQGEKEGQFVGEDGFPSKELIRFKSDQHLGFPGQPITKVLPKKTTQENKQSVDMFVNFMGLTGPSGVLPQHYSELLLQRLKQRDTTMRDFFDLFNHRLISLYYRAWKKYRMPCQYEQGGLHNEDSFSHVLSAMVGGGEPLKTYYGGWFNKTNRSAEGLRCMLMDFIGCEVDIEQLEGRWIGLSIDDQSCLTSEAMPEGQFARLGKDATLGSRAWDISSSIKVIIRPTKEARMPPSDLVKLLLPGTELLKRVNTLVSDFVGASIHAKVELRTQTGNLVSTSLGDHEQKLGRNARLSLGQGSQNKTICI